MITSVIAKTMDLVALSAKEREQVAAYREQISDEVALNRSLLADFVKRKKRVRVSPEDADEFKALLGLLKDSAYQRVQSGDLSLKRVFPDKLHRPASPDASDGKGTRQYLSWVQKDQTVSELLRRFFGKIELLTAQGDKHRKQQERRKNQTFLVSHENNVLLRVIVK